MKLDVLGANAVPEPWYAAGLNFTCTQCGNCCTGGPGFVWISDEEVSRLAEHLGLGRAETVDRYCRRVGGRLSLKETRNARGEHDCVFLREEAIERAEKDGGAAGPAERVLHTRRSCTIYPVRPMQCRTWPFWDGNLASPEIWDRSAQRCHGMNQGRHFTREQIERLRDATDWPRDGPTSENP